jgi:hemoglobin
MKHSTENPDICNRDDLVDLLNAFYAQVLNDPIIGFYFTDVVHFSLAEHIPKVADFWTAQLFGSLNYQGRTFETHLALHRHTAITRHHFHRWLHLFSASIDAGYAGANAEALKHRAQTIATSMATALSKQTTTLGEAEGIFIPPAIQHQE